MLSHKTGIEKEPAMKRTERRRRIENALWGLFIGDALAMPAHWYYDPENIEKDFNGGLRGYAAPPHPHPESFMVGMDYRPDVERAKRIGRPYDILHDHVRYYDTTYSALSISSTRREHQHGNLTPEPGQRYHYHYGLSAGENTLGAQLVRVLMRSVAEKGRYDPQDFIGGFVDHLSTPGRNRDPYTEIYIRRWFENYAAGLPPENCAAFQRSIWSIGSHGGMVRPLVLALLASSPYQALGLAAEHHNLTHRSENNLSALGIVIPLLFDLLDGARPLSAAAEHGQRIRLPKITGKELFALYRSHEGPDNIPDDTVWRIHTELSDEPLDLSSLIREHDEKEVTRNLLATACYPEHGLPMLLYLACRHQFDPGQALLANTNAGGDNVHRGMLLGALLGAAASDKLPEPLLEGLAEHRRLSEEIAAFTDVAVSGQGL